MAIKNIYIYIKAFDKNVIAISKSMEIDLKDVSITYKYTI